MMFPVVIREWLSRSLAKEETDAVMDKLHAPALGRWHIRVANMEVWDSSEMKCTPYIDTSTAVKWLRKYGGEL